MRREKGSVLVIVLFMVFFLAAIALSLSYTAQLEMTAMRRYIDMQKSFYLAQGVMKLVIEELKADKLSNNVDSYLDAYHMKFRKDDRASKLDISDDAGNSAGSYQVVITDERAKININKVSSQTIKELLRNFKGINSSRVDRDLISLEKNKSGQNKYVSIYEWRKLLAINDNAFWGEDINNNGILDAWENDGAETLPEDNGNGELDLGIKDFLTVHTDGKVNVNTAVLPVLASLPGMNDEIAQLIIDRRYDKPFQNLDELKNAPFISSEINDKILSWAAARSDIFTVSVVARASGTNTPRQILAVVDRSQDEVRIKYWRED